MHRSSSIASSYAFLRLTEESHQTKLSRLREDKRFWLNVTIALLGPGFILLFSLLLYELLINHLDGGASFRMAWLIVTVLVICAGSWAASLYNESCKKYKQEVRARKS